MIRDLLPNAFLFETERWSRPIPPDAVTRLGTHNRSGRYKSGSQGVRTLNVISFLLPFARLTKW